MSDPVRVDDRRSVLTGPDEAPGPAAPVVPPVVASVVAPVVTPKRETPAAPPRWNELTGLLVGDERRRLDRLETKMDDPGLFGAKSVAAVLPDAITRRAGDKALGSALAPIVGEAIKSSVRRDPQPLVDAIFPVIGPAIRRAVASAFAELAQSVNGTLEHAFTIRGLRWRMEAWRSGRSFGEVVLNHSILYRVEQLFLVHRETGLLVAHVTAPGVKSLSPDMVAGMLTAVTDFARDSFGVERNEGLDSFALGDLTVEVADGTSVSLAAVVRGRVPAGLREQLQRAVEGVQAVHAEELETFARDGVTFRVRQDLLEPCLTSQAAESAARPSLWRLALLGALVLAALLWFVLPRVLERRRFDAGLQALREEPGIVVSSVGRGGLAVSGLRDPMATDPMQVLAGAGVDTTRVSARWEPYVALRPEFVTRRAQRALNAPASVALAMRGDTLVASGAANAAWIREATRLAPMLPGVGAVAFGDVRDAALDSLQALARVTEGMEVPFARGSAAPDGAAWAAAERIAQSLRALRAFAVDAGYDVEAVVVGSADTSGSSETNSELRLRRAQRLSSMLRDGMRLSGVPIRVSPDSSTQTRTAAVRVDIHPQSGSR